MSIIDVASEFKSALQESADLYLHFLRIPSISALPTLLTLPSSPSPVAPITSPFPSPPPAVPPTPPTPTRPAPLPVRESGIEAAFLRMFKAWEAFQEDCVLAFMKGEARIDGKIIKSYVRKLRYEAPARKLLLQGKLYIEWTKPKDVIRRVDIFFPNAALITDPLGDFESALTEIYDVRNAIAHSSAHSLAQLKKIADNVKGASKNPKRAFDCLVIEPKDNSKDYFRKLPSYGFIEKNRMTFFDVYEEVLFVLAKQILGGFPP